MMKKKPQGRKSHTVKESELNHLFAELKGEYLDSFPEKIETIRQFWESGDRTGLHNEFHKIKGTGTTYGLPEVTDIAEILEEMCEQECEKLGAGIVIALDLLQKICQSYKFDVEFDLHKDPLFKRLKVMFDEMEMAS